MEKKQTAVEWLIKQFNLQNYIPHIMSAKSMEKKQMIDAYLQGSFDDGPDVNKAEQYYNETYGK